MASQCTAGAARRMPLSRPPPPGVHCDVLNTRRAKSGRGTNKFFFDRFFMLSAWQDSIHLRPFISQRAPIHGWKESSHYLCLHFCLAGESTAAVCSGDKPLSLRLLLSGVECARLHVVLLIRIKHTAPSVFILR